MTRLEVFKEKNYEKFSNLLLGNDSAIDLICILFVAFHVLDDLIDKDVKVGDDDISNAFFEIIINLPCNMFYMNNFNLLYPLIINAYINWKLANAYEEKEEKLHIAYIIRSAYIEVLQMCVFIVGGLDWALKCANDIRELAHGETYEGYLINLEQEKKLRGI